ncbi:MAG: hypothetical protein HY294_09750 [Candidatus Rokubacteria bacterium]|nr:hypothetical protein [Candidatus Rokubacteria bacterium]MBI3826268.1 hypothetical protein [Candidatus Rokubacteria bacterium]
MGRRAATIALVTFTLVAALATLAPGQAVRVGGKAPEIAGGPWINSAALDLAAVRGRVVLVEFWTFG